ncbi:hypothetical protein MOQ_001170 [Trypanosoma cruzi marinkellei]|uniref:Uncharacterized protein n=1 Tax=Trypanosoma cruzi marinkellei TaxID=85056 RepID=K2MTT2_TRYCR|nr:hypothetical protein MOQ_001170 [Trypanosoma cruzi marinkellei]
MDETSLPSEAIMTLNGHSGQNGTASPPTSRKEEEEKGVLQVETDDVVVVVVTKKEGEIFGSDAGVNAPEPMEANNLSNGSPAGNETKEVAEGPHTPPAAAPRDVTPVKEETTDRRTGEDDTTSSANAETSSQPQPRSGGDASGEEGKAAATKEGEAQRQPTVVGVAAHRVFTEEELAAYMEKQRQREREKEEVRHTKFRRNSGNGGSRSRGSRGNASSMRIPPIDANAMHLPQLPHAHQQFFTAPTAAAPPLAAGAAPHPLAYQLAYTGASGPPAGVELSIPPYSNPFAANTAPPFNDRLRLPLLPQQQPQQQQQPFQQPPALCAPWGIQLPSQPPFMGLPPPCAAPGIFDPATVMRFDQQLQHMNELGAQFLPSAPIPNPAPGSMTGMNMQELEVLARLIVLARNEQQQQQQQQQPPFVFSQKQQAQPPQYCYYPGRRQSDMENVVNSLNAPNATHVGVNASPACNKMHDGAATLSPPGVLEGDPRIVVMEGKHNGTDS